MPLDPVSRNRLGHIVADSRANLIATDCRNLPLARESARDRARWSPFDAGSAAPPRATSP